jgi:hypothetical protein
MSTGKKHTPPQMTQPSFANSVNDVLMLGHGRNQRCKSCSVYLSLPYSKYTRKWPVDIKWKMKIWLRKSCLLNVILGKAITFPKIRI